MDTFRWQNIQKKFSYPKVLKVQTATKWLQICVTFLLCIVNGRNFSLLKTLETLLGGKMFRKSSPLQVLKIQMETKWPKICVTFLLCIVDRRNFSLLKTLATLLGGKMFRKSFPIHRCLKLQWRPNSPIFVLPFYCAMLNGGIFLCSKH